MSLTNEPRMSAVDTEFDDEFLFELVDEQLSDGEAASLLCFGCRGCALCGVPVLGGP